MLKRATVVIVDVRALTAKMATSFHAGRRSDGAGVAFIACPDLMQHERVFGM
jgi:hypothetical protein